MLVSTGAPKSALPLIINVGTVDGGVLWAALDCTSAWYVCHSDGERVAAGVRVLTVTGNARAIVDEQPDTFFCYSSKTFLEHLPKTKELIWMSERDGWNHLYLIDRAEGSVQLWIEDALDEIEAKGEMEVIKDFAYKVPMTVILDLMGVPDLNREKIKQWSEELGLEEA